MSYVRGVGVDENAFDRGPDDWTPAAASGDVPLGEPVAGDAAGTPVVLVRGASGVRALHDRCSHRGCSLAGGALHGDVIECTCHGSLFRLDDGGIERGPASSPQPVFDVREREGNVEVRLRPGQMPS
jgi:nitrite reductase/ring-hydroxylating ferredoxin subunit